VDEQSGWPVDVPYDDIDVAIVVDVAERRSAAHLERLEDGARLTGHVFETAIPKVSEEKLALAVGKSLGRALLDRFDRSVHRQEVQPAVVVEVEPRGAEAGVPPAHRTEARRRAQVFEKAGPVIRVKVVAFGWQLSGEEILVSIVVEIAGVDSHAPLGFAVG